MQVYKFLHRCFYFTVIVLLMIFFVNKAIGEIRQNEEGTEGVISLTPPSLDDEETHSTHMPEMFKCDACTAIAYQFSVSFASAHAKRSKKKLPESEMYQLVEEVCGGEGMTKYGVKEVRKQKHLSGPGLPSEESPGIMQGGGRWPDRMNKMCNRYVELFDEEGIYDAWLEDRDGLKTFLCDSITKPGLTDVCMSKSKTKAKQKKREEL